MTAKICNERTPLLQSEQCTPCVEQEDIICESTSLPRSDGLPHKTPLNMKQMMIILIVTFVEPVQFGILFPFMYFMVRDFNVTDDEKMLGRYVGLLASSFCLAQLFSSLPWGWVSDKIGRRPVILIGLIGNAITCSMFGASESYAFSLTLRTICGLLNGNIGVVKSMLGEMTDHTNRGLAFAYWESAFGLGSIVGPVLGGMLVYPADKFPGWFGHNEFLKRFPYFLPCFVSSIISLLGALAGYLFLEETLQKRDKKKRVAARNAGDVEDCIANSSSHDDMDCSQTDPLIRESQVSTNTLIESRSSALSRPSESEAAPIVGPSNAIMQHQSSSFFSVDSYIAKSSLSVIMTRKVVLAVLSYATWSLIQVIYEEVYALYVATNLKHGGLQFTSTDIGTAMALEGIVQVFVQVIIYPALEAKLGRVGTFRMASITMAIFAVLTPCVTDIARYVLGVGLPSSNNDGYQDSAQKSMVFWILMLVLTGRFFACVCGFIPVMLFVNDSAPYKESLGTVHGFGQVAASLVRSIGPAMGGFLWSWSLSNDLGFPFDFHFTLVLVGALSVFSIYLSLFLKDEEHESEEVY